MGVVTNTITIDVPFKDLSHGYNGIVMSVAEFKSQYLWGIPLCNQVTGETLSDSVIQQKLNAAQKYIESMLDLKLFKQYVEEQKNFVRDEYISWGYTKASWFVNKPFFILGRINEQIVLTYPSEWVTTQRKIIKDDTFSKNMYFVPNGKGSGVTSFALNFTINNVYSFYGSRVIPEYWDLQYLTGFEIIPADIINLVGKKAAIELLPVIEMTITSGGGYTFGSASNSLGLDGMSQSISKANGGNIFKQRLEMYDKQLSREIAQLKHVYTGFTFDVF